MNIVLKFGLSCIFLTALLCDRVSASCLVCSKCCTQRRCKIHNHNLLSHSPMFPISHQLSARDLATRSSNTCRQCHHACAGTITTILAVLGVQSPGPGSCLYRYRGRQGILVTTATPTLTQVVARKQGRSYIFLKTFSVHSQCLSTFLKYL